MTFLPNATIKRMLKSFFPEDQIGGKTIERLIIIAEDFIRITYMDAKKYAEAGKRKVVSERDVIFASS